MSLPTSLAHEHVMVIFTTSPAGLGHVRVMEALRGGLPEDVRSETIGVEDPQIQFLHRITSRNTFLLRFMEFGQMNEKIEDSFTHWYTNRIRTHTRETYESLRDLIQRRRPVPKIVLCVATHVSLAHQIASIKHTLEKELEVKILLATVVTDDTKQKIWAVWGSDILFVPSMETAALMSTYLTSKPRSERPAIVVNPYPVSPRLSVPLSESEFEFKRLQASNRAKKPVNIVMPVSGAAVQISYLQSIISYTQTHLSNKTTVIARDSSYTKSFLKWCSKQKDVEVIAYKHDREVVISYEEAYQRETFLVEITKPSEQAFKVLMSPKKRGGVILLFAKPVGSQEYDNVEFLKRHEYIPNDEDQKYLNELFHGSTDLSFLPHILKQARKWRGIVLPVSGEHAGYAVALLKELGILSVMVEYSRKDMSLEEKDDGVKRFWERLRDEM